MAKPYEKLDSKSRELACEAAMTAAAEIINEVCGTEGSKGRRDNRQGGEAELRS
ncbi:unnamed protein product, partial [marine sediment metagenome]